MTSDLVADTMNRDRDRSSSSSSSTINSSPTCDSSRHRTPIASKSSSPFRARQPNGGNDGGTCTRTTSPDSIDSDRPTTSSTFTSTSTGTASSPSLYSVEFGDFLQLRILFLLLLLPFVLALVNAPPHSQFRSLVATLSTSFPFSFFSTSSSLSHSSLPSSIHPSLPVRWWDELVLSSAASRGDSHVQLQELASIALPISYNSAISNTYRQCLSSSLSTSSSSYCSPSFLSSIRSSVVIGGQTMTLTRVVDDPCIVMIQDFVSDTEAKELIRLGEPLLEPSYVSEPGTGRKTYTSGRNSSTHYFPHQSHPLITKLEERLAHLTDFPLDHFVGLNFLRYTPTQLFGLHYDSKEYNRDIGSEGMRFYSLLLYLNDLPPHVQDDAESRGGGGDGDGDEPGFQSGGSTDFPLLPFRVRPKRGLAIWWANIDADGRMDTRLIHEGRPPTASTKFVINMYAKEGAPEFVFPPTHLHLHLHPHNDDDHHSDGESISDLPSSLFSTSSSPSICRCPVCSRYRWNRFDHRQRSEEEKLQWGKERAWMIMETTKPTFPFRLPVPRKRNDGQTEIVEQGAKQNKIDT